jgi:conjugative transposon TraN protein
MKRILCVAAFNCLSIIVMAQTSLCISSDKTTSLVFPFAISHVDRGNQSVLAQAVKEVPTILLVKAAEKNFPETNLSVVTEDGSIYSFLVCYENAPQRMVYHLPANHTATVSSYANNILDNPATIKGIRNYKWQMVSKITGIYIKNDVIYYQLYLENKSPLNYNIDLIRFYIRDKKKGKRTAIQENELKPVYVAGNTTQVNAKGTSVIVFALDKFTIPNGKYLGIEIMEKNGGRHLSMKVNNKKIMQAITLPDLK